MGWLGDRWDDITGAASDGWDWLTGDGPAGWIRALIISIFGIAVAVFAVAVIIGFSLLAEAALFFIVLAAAVFVLYTLISYIITRNDDDKDD